jgi:hypothetical protein
MLFSFFAGRLSPRPLGSCSNFDGCLSLSRQRRTRTLRASAGKSARSTPGAGRQDNVINAQDRAEILDLRGRYFFSVDSGDHNAVVNAFTADGVVRYDTSELYEGADGLRRFAGKAIGGESTRGRMHLKMPLYFRREGAAVVLTSTLSSARCVLPERPRPSDHCATPRIAA